MANKPVVNIGDRYVATGTTQQLWRVAATLADGIHVVLVCEGEPSLRKTMSAWALLDSRHFVRARSEAA